MLSLDFFSFYLCQVKDVLNASNLHDVMEKSLLSVEKLNSLNIFKRVNLKFVSFSLSHLRVSFLSLSLSLFLPVWLLP